MLRRNHMNLGESFLYAAVMTMLEEAKDNERKFSTTTQSAENNINVKYTFENLKTKDKLITLADKLFVKADEECNTFNEIDTPMLVSSLITKIVYESVKSTCADSDTKNIVFDYALEYCNVQTDFTWELLEADINHELENCLNQVSDSALDTVFIASTVSSDNDGLSVAFIRFLTELMMYLEKDVALNFPAMEFEKKFLAVTFEYILAAMNREKHRLEEENPSLKEDIEAPIDYDRISELKRKARTSLKCDDTYSAAAYYRQISELAPDDWEAVFYKEFCPAFNTPERVCTRNIRENATKIAKSMSKAMSLAKKQVIMRSQLVYELCDVCMWLTKLSTNYFVATMNEFRSSPQGKAENALKSNQVYWIIQMLFSCGDAIEQNFSSDFELCKIECVSCWKTAFTCYENCKMSAPSNLFNYYVKIIKYDPSYKCSKSLVGSNKGEETDGCYIATSVYGSYDCPQVWTLRRFRDFWLKRHFCGRFFVRIYYTFSPTLVRLFGKTKWFNNGCKKMLDKFVRKLQVAGYENSPYNDLR